jgi:peptide/nickel transport system substrate-binding protein
VSTFARQVGYDRTEIVDSLTFRIKTTAPCAILTDQLTSLPMLPPAYYESESADNLSRVNQQPLGSGAWKFVEWQKDQRIVLEANTGWWNGPPPFERVVFRPIAESSTRILALKTGEVDLIVNVPPDSVAAIKKGERTRVSSVEGPRKIFVGMRTDKQPLGDKRVRQALNYALNFDAINRALLGGNGKRMKSLVNPPHEPRDAKPYPYDVNRARSLLATAGYPNGFGIEMMAPDGRYTEDKQMAQAIAQDLEKIGVKVNLQVLEWSLYAGDILARHEPSPCSSWGWARP